MKSLNRWLIVAGLAGAGFCVGGLMAIGHRALEAGLRPDDPARAAVYALLIVAIAVFLGAGWALSRQGGRACADRVESR